MRVAPPGSASTTLVAHALGSSTPPDAAAVYPYPYAPWPAGPASPGSSPKPVNGSGGFESPAPATVTPAARPDASYWK